MITSELSPKDWVTLIGILFTLFVGLLNVSISIHKTQTETIIQSKLQYLEQIRELSSKILGWRHGESLAELRSTVSKLIFYFDPSIDSDNEIVSILLSLLENGYKLSFYKGFESVESREIYNKFHQNKKDFNYLIKVILKREQIRIDAENRYFRIPFKNYWLPIRGFCENWATNSLKKKMRSVYSNFPSTWILLKANPDVEKEKDIISIREFDKASISTGTDTIDFKSNKNVFPNKEITDIDHNECEVTFFHPTTGATLTALVSEELTAKEVIDALIQEDFIRPYDGDYYLESPKGVLVGTQKLKENASKEYVIVSSSYAG